MQSITSPGGWLAAAMLATMVASPGVEAGLAAHRAAYRVVLAKGYGLSAPFLDAHGGLAIEWRRTCDGWLSWQRLAFVATQEDGQEIRHDVHYNSWEALDGTRLRYTIRRFDGTRLEEEYRGEARLQSIDGPGVASFTVPEEKKVELPAGTVFPTAHLERLLASAEHGERLVSHAVFDGWGFDALTQITSVIGQLQTVAPWGDDGRDGGRAWPVSMAYYNVEGGQELPEFEASFLLTESGILRDLRLDYVDFGLETTLEELELLAPPDC